MYPTNLQTPEEMLERWLSVQCQCDISVGHLCERCHDTQVLRELIKERDRLRGVIMTMPYVCEVCGKQTQRWRRCEDHYRCDDCGTGDGLCMYVEGVLCNPCHGARVEERISKFNGDHEYTHEAVCPHCGYVHRDSWDMSEGVRNCNDCGREFDLTRHTEVTYTTIKT